MQQNLRKLLTDDLYWSLEKLNNITELRVRQGKQLVAYTFADRFVLDYVVSKMDIEHILRVATARSLYSVEDSIKCGYITYEGGIRIGVAGEALLDNGKLRSIKNINSLVIRVPKSICTLPKEVVPIVRDFSNTLIISPPYFGKTTLLREMTRQISNNGSEVLVIDERNELSASVNGVASLDLGANTDVMVGVPKINCYEGAVRTMSPSVIATDEIFGRAEVDCIIDATRCGVKVIATAHGNDIDDFLSKGDYARLNGVIENYVLLGCKVGKVMEVRGSCMA